VGGKTNSFGGAEDSDIRAELMVIPLILAPKIRDRSRGDPRARRLGRAVPLPR
jgi:hypothetical protein